MPRGGGHSGEQEGHGHSWGWGLVLRARELPQASQERQGAASIPPEPAIVLPGALRQLPPLGPPRLIAAMILHLQFFVLLINGPGD